MRACLSQSAENEPVSELPDRGHVQGILNNDADACCASHRASVDPTSDYMKLLRQMWDSGKSDVGPWDFARVAEIAFLRNGYIQEWFFSAKDRALRRKATPNRTIVRLREWLVSRADPRAGGVVAVAVFHPHDAPFSSVLPVDAQLLTWLLDEAAPKRREPLRALIKYSRPRGEYDAVLRYDWREKITDWEMRRSRVSIVSDAPLWLRLTTHGAAMGHSEKERYVPSTALQKCRNTCAALAERLLSRAEHRSLRVVADFRLLGMPKARLPYGRKSR